MFKPIVQNDLLIEWNCDPDSYFGLYPRKVAIEIDPARDPQWITDPSVFKVALLIEPPTVNRGIEERYLSNNWHKFDLVLTYYDSLLQIAKNSIFFYFGDTWIKTLPTDLRKDRLVSFITSKKNFTPGHALRLEIAEKMNNSFDLFGRGFREIQKKEEGLCQYMFSICVENENMNGWFTEKIVDCFRTKTIPIYCGCPNIGDFYNEKGIIKFSSLQELSEILQNLDRSLYESMSDAMEDNWNKAANEKPFEVRVNQAIVKHLKTDLSD